MTARGQILPPDGIARMTVLWQQAEICWPDRLLPLCAETGPRRDRRRASAPTQSGRSPALLDNLVRAYQHRLRHSEAERLGGLEIDDQLEGRRLLDRQIGGLGTLEDLSRVSAD
jgi:hypothetical protein